METVFLIDDDPGVRRALGRALYEYGFACHCFDSAEDFLARRPPGTWGCLVLDVSMPGLDGYTLWQKLRDEGADMPAIFVTGKGSVSMTVRAMKAGASDFLEKPVAAASLVAAIRAAIDESVAHKDANDEAAQLSRLYAGLTIREREVLTRVASGKLNKQIAVELGVVEQTIKFQRARIMQRMQAHTVAELMRMSALLGVGVGASRNGTRESPHRQTAARSQTGTAGTFRD